MFNSEKNIYIYESETKPNQYAMFVILCLFGCVIFSWIMNEIGLFRVDKTVMRIGSIVPIFLCGSPLFVLFIKKDLRSNPITKYILLIICSFITLIVTTLLFFHTALLLIFPLALSMLYRSKKLGIVAACISLLMTLLAPLISYLLGVWDVPLFQELILIATNSNVEIVGASNAITGIAVGKILLYLVLPRLTMVGSFAILTFYVISVGVKNVNNQIILSNISQRDTLTGLYNQNYYNKIISSTEYTGSIGIIFFDCNGLKQLNDTKGHETGDVYLKRCAKSLSDICDEDKTSAFRVGGDEFVILIENANDAMVNKKILEWKDSLIAINKENLELYEGLECTMAYGYVVGDFKNIAELVHIADKRMYVNKSMSKVRE